MMFSRAQVSAARVNQVLATTVDITDRPDSHDRPIYAGQVEFSNVSFRYPGAVGPPVLKNISFIAEPGTTVAILGATGAGEIYFG